jgi:alkanesulfonate monooxygenase SsuD/methylene tetrahydromethanopterin reductase-like flavin-dependent oxidoreductase (luciferase family)
MDVDVILNEFDSPGAIAEQAMLAERYGFRAAWATSYATGRDCSLSLAEAAGATSKIRTRLSKACRTTLSMR